MMVWTASARYNLIFYFLLLYIFHTLALKGTFPTTVIEYRDYAFSTGAAVDTFSLNNAIKEYKWEGGWNNHGF